MAFRILRVYHLAAEVVEDLVEAGVVDPEEVKRRALETIRARIGNIAIPWEDILVLLIPFIQKLIEMLILYKVTTTTTKNPS